MHKPVFIEGILGESIKGYIMRVLALRLKHDTVLEFHNYRFVIQSGDTYDNTIHLFREGFYEKILHQFVKPQQNLDYMIEELSLLLTSLDDLMGWLVIYCTETQTPVIISHRWRVLQILTNAGFRPLDEDLRICPKKLLTLELIIGVFMHNMITYDSYMGIYSAYNIFTKTEQYRHLKRSMDRKKTIDEMLKIL